MRSQSSTFRNQGRAVDWKGVSGGGEEPGRRELVRKAADPPPGRGSLSDGLGGMGACHARRPTIVALSLSRPTRERERTLDALLTRTARES